MFIYAISDGEFVKLGKANNPLIRLANLQTGNPRKLKILFTIRCDNPFTVEAALHRFYKNCHISGEWFKITNITTLYNNVKYAISAYS